MERLVGTVSRGIRAPIIREGDDIAQIVVDSVLAAAEQGGFSLGDRDVVAVTEAVVQVLCERVCYVAGVTLMFLIFLIALMTIANIPNLSYRIPNMDLLNDAGGAVMGLINGVCYCCLAAWLLRFLGLIIGMDTFESTLLAKFFHSIDIITAGVGI